jgi:hypothetical protein
MARPLACEAMTGRHRKIPVHGRPTGALALLLVVIVVACVVLATILVAAKAQRSAVASLVPVVPERRTAAQMVLVDTTGCGAAYSGARPHVARLGRYLQDRFDVATVAANGHDEDHNVGLALDFTFTDRGDGDEFARYLVNNRERLGINYVMWWKRVNIDGSWHTMRNRGTVGANHYDNVHVSFRSRAPQDVPECEE